MADSHGVSETKTDPRLVTDQFDLTGRRALVTGASRGLGRAIALGFAERGANVMAVARTPGDLEETARLGEAEAGSVCPYVADLSNPETIESIVAAGAEILGGLDILVNNAGADHDSPIEETKFETWRSVVDVNLDSCWLMCQAASDLLATGGGKVINVASMLGLVAVRNNSAYVASKHGLVGLTRALALEWARRDVQVNAIAPGFVETNMTRDALTDDRVGNWIRKRTPVGRWAQPDEIVGPAIFLASSASDFMTGQVLVVDGGWTAQ